MSAEVVAVIQPTKQTSESEDLSDNLPDEQNAVFEVRYKISTTFIQFSFSRIPQIANQKSPIIIVI